MPAASRPGPFSPRQEAPRATVLKTPAAGYLHLQATDMAAVGSFLYPCGGYYHNWKCVECDPAIDVAMNIYGYGQ